MLLALVGRPSVGKSSFFKAATLAAAEVGNYPFTTVKSSEATAYVKVDCVDKEFHTQCHPRMGYCLDHKRFVPVRLLDVPGLIENAHLGEGMGNLFLDDLNQADALIHVVDVSGSTNEKGEAVEPGSYDPAKDIIFLEKELDMWYLRILRKGWERFVRTQIAEKGELHKALAQQLSGLRVSELVAKEALMHLQLPAEIHQWQEEQLLALASELRKRTKPMVVAANKIDVAAGRINYERLLSLFPAVSFIPCSAEAELALKEATKKGLVDYIPGEEGFVEREGLTAQQKQGLQFVRTHVLEEYGSTGVQDILDFVVFTILKKIVVFPGGVNKLADKHGNVLPDCFLLDTGSTALDFAYKVHTDIGKGFIRAIDVKTKRTVGKDHVLKHLDVIEIVAKT